jgi:2-polyprenyl-3-methyl-5-hydroxy-6-metoxy-1,4-benzoquinol methylase
MSLNTLSLDREEVCLKGKRLYVYRPARLEDVFQGDPFLEAHRFPFWVMIWPASLAVAQYLASLPPPLDILEIGAGLGIPSLFASAFGHRVLATDKEELPLKLLKRSAEEQGLDLSVKTLDWINPNLEKKFDVIAGAEVVIKSSLFDPLFNLFRSYLKPDGHIILAHESERKRTLVPFLVKAEEHFKVETKLVRLKDEEKIIEIVLNRLTLK